MKISVRRHRVVEEDVDVEFPFYAAGRIDDEPAPTRWQRFERVSDDGILVTAIAKLDNGWRMERFETSQAQAADLIRHIREHWLEEDQAGAEAGYYRAAELCWDFALELLQKPE